MRPVVPGGEGEGGARALEGGEESGGEGEVPGSQSVGACRGEGYW